MTTPSIEVITQYLKASNLPPHISNSIIEALSSKTDSPEWLKNPGNDDIRDAAREQWQENDLEIDDQCYLSPGGDEDGMWVSAWVWVNDKEIVSQVRASKTHTNIDITGNKVEIPHGMNALAISEGENAHRVFWDDSTAPMVYQHSDYLIACEPRAPS